MSTAPSNSYPGEVAAPCQVLSLADEYRRAAGHLRAIGAHREYLVSRYDPEPVAVSEINRLESTLIEVADKVAKLLARDALAQLHP